MFTDCFNRIFDRSIRVSRSFANYVGGRTQQTIGRGWALPGVPLGTPLFETTLSCALVVSAILVSDSCFMPVHSL